MAAHGDIQHLVCTSATGMAQGDIQHLVCTSATGLAKSTNKDTLVLEETVSQELENNVNENLTVCSLCFANTILSKDFDEEFFEEVDPVTVFDVDQPVSHQKIKSLIKLTCETLMKQVKTYEECNIDQEYVHSSVAKCYMRLRSHEKEAFIKISDFLDVHDSSTFRELMKHVVFSSEKKDSTFDGYIREFFGSVQFLGSVHLLGFKELQRDIKKLDKTTEQLQELITKDPRLTDHLNSKVVEYFVEILETIPNTLIQSRVVRILSRGRYYDCRDVITQKAVPVLVKFMCGEFKHISNEVVFTLTRLACASSDHIDAMVNCGALEAALDVLTKATLVEVRVVYDVALFLAVVCRANNLSSHKVQVAITIAQNIFQKEVYLSYTLHIARACYALSYLTYGRCVELIEEVLCESLIELLIHDENLVVFAALGVVGNIVRWGNSKQIQYLTKDCQLLIRLKKIVLCSELKKFQMGACQIISNIAARSETWIKDRDDTGLIEPLFKLLKMGEYDVRVEAAWAIFNGVYAYKFEQLDKDDKST